MLCRLPFRKHGNERAEIQGDRRNPAEPTHELNRGLAQKTGIPAACFCVSDGSFLRSHLLELDLYNDIPQLRVERTELGIGSELSVDEWICHRLNNHNIEDSALIKCGFAAFCDDIDSCVCPVGQARKDCGLNTVSTNSGGYCQKTVGSAGFERIDNLVN